MADKNNIPQFVNSNSFMADKNYVKWVSDLKKRFRMAQLKAAVKVNTQILLEFRRGHLRKAETIQVGRKGYR